MRVDEVLVEVETVILDDVVVVACGMGMQITVSSRPETQQRVLSPKDLNNQKAASP